MDILASLVPHAPEATRLELERLEQPEAGDSVRLSYSYRGNYGWMFTSRSPEISALKLWFAKLSRVPEATRRELVGRALHLIDTYPVEAGEVFE
jgi:hypothetical protein